MFGNAEYVFQRTERKEETGMRFDNKLIRIVSVCVAVALSLPIIISVVSMFVEV